MTTQVCSQCLIEFPSRNKLFAHLNACTGGTANKSASKDIDVAGAGDEPEAEPAADESWWEVIYGDTVEGAGRTMELDTTLQAFASAVEVDGAMGLQLRSSIARKPQNITFRRFF